MKRISIFVFVLFISFHSFAQKQFELTSPDSFLTLKVEIGSQLRWSVKNKQNQIISPSQIDLELFTGEKLSQTKRLIKAVKSEVNRTFKPPIYNKAEVVEKYRQLSINLGNKSAIIFRLYNDGMAYRWVTYRKEELIIKNEVAEFNLPSTTTSFVQYIKSKDTVNIANQFWNSFENLYKTVSLKEWSNTRLAVLPVLVKSKEGYNISIMDMDIQDYPGMYLQNFDSDNSLNAVFAPCSKKRVQGGHNNLQSLIESREEYIAKTKGTRTFPWRVTCIAKSDAELANTDLAYLLAEESRISDTSWIKPGKVAWDWWNDWNISGVDFKAGINTETYKYYIDFAAQNKLEYVILDEGFNVKNKADLMQIIPEINLQELCDYAKKKNVGLILWAGMYAMDKDMDAICKHFSDMGIKGFKVDFLDHDDQYMMNFTWRLAEICAKYKLLLDYHGVFKPNGLQRTYPNVISFEGVFGLENVKYTPEMDGMMKHDVTIPFIRNIAGPMDYTPGAMRNASRKGFKAINSMPMSLGTRCHQLAQYIVFQSPLAMLCDSPTAYEKESECKDFIKDIPTVWDETKILDGKVGEYIITAKRKGNVWYVAGMTNWDERTVDIDLSFIDANNPDIEIFADGINAERNANDYKRTISKLIDKKVSVNMKPGGGFAMKVFSN